MNIWSTVAAETLRNNLIMHRVLGNLSTQQPEQLVFVIS
jgi:hypothetical protein